MHRRVSFQTRLLWRRWTTGVKNKTGVVVTDDEGQLVVTAEYNTDLYDTATIARMLRHFVLLVERLTAEPNVDVASVSLL